MTYSYCCEKCNYFWDANLQLDSRDLPLGEPCPNCALVGEVKRTLSAPSITYGGGKTVLQRAGSGWNDVLNKVKKSSGRLTKMETR